MWGKEIRSVGGEASGNQKDNRLVIGIKTPLAAGEKFTKLENV